MLTRPKLIGRRKDGRPIYLIQGGAEPPAFQQPPAPTGTADPPGDPAGTGGDDGGGDDGGDPPPADLGAAGQAAIDRMKAKVKDATAAKKAAEAKAAELQAQLDKAGKGEDGKPAEPDLTEIRKQAKAEAEAGMLRERALDKVEVAAAKTFANPAIARALLSSKVDEFVDGSKVDTDAIGDALADLLKAEPYLAATNGKRFQGTGDNGPRGREPQNLADRIAEAKKAGNHRAVVALEMQKLREPTK